MVWSKWVTGIRESFQRSSRGGRKIDRIIIHHTATTNGEWTLDAMTSGSKEVSANYVPDKDGKLWGVVPEEFRAWTSASAAWDGRAVTMECVNNSTNGWTISDASYETIAKLLADVSTRYNFKLVRNGANSTVLGHKELYIYWGDSYATACPGGIDIDRIVRRANEIKANSGSSAGGGGSVITPEDEDEDMFKPTVHKRSDGTPEWTLGHPEIGSDLKRYTGPNTGTSRKDGKVTVFRGFMVTADPEIGLAWARTYARGSGGETSATNRDDYIEIQVELSRVATEFAV